MKKNRSDYLITVLLIIAVGCNAQHNDTTGYKHLKMKDSTLYIFQIPKSEYDREILYYADQSVSGSSALEVLSNSTEEVKAFIESIPSDKIDYEYGTYKWTVGEVLQHIISYEKIMTDRIRLILDKNADLVMPHYTQASTIAGAIGKSKEQLLSEFMATRSSLTEIIEELPEEELKKMGSLDGFKVSIRALVACASGHQQHHFKVIRERYLL